MAKSLLQMMEEEQAQGSPKPIVRKNPVLAIADNGGKNKQISAKVNAKTYDIFTQINQMQGLSNNSALNMIITKYVRENKGILNL